MDVMPHNFDEFVGQEKARRVLEILCRSAKKQNKPVCHVLFSGPPGLGKSTCARILSHEMGSNLVELLASHVQQHGQLTSQLLRLKERDVLFIDEIHSLSGAVEECLYSAMEGDRRITLVEEGYASLLKSIGVSGTATGAQKVVSLPPFTLIGATTKQGVISSPLRSRFVQHITLEPYSVEDLFRIVTNAGGKLGFEIPADSAMEIARRSRGTARTAIQHMTWVREYCTAMEKAPDVETVREAFLLRDVDEYGLTKTDRDYLSVLVEAGSPVGVETIAMALNENEDTLKQTIEPHLVRTGFIRKTTKGRVATELWRKLVEKKGAA